MLGLHTRALWQKINTTLNKEIVTLATENRFELEVIRSITICKCLLKL